MRRVIFSALSVLVLPALWVGGLSAAQASEAAQVETRIIPPPPAAILPPADVMMILDGSGSMWGQINGQHKIVVARDTIQQVLQEWNAELKLGLLSYGLRTPPKSRDKANACIDIEVIVDPAANSSGEINQVVQRLNPQGWTPLSQSLITSAEKLDFRNKRAALIVVSDGKETCDMDPCAVARQLKQEGHDFTAHVVGFDLNPEERANLMCIAEETGGIYADAREADQLLQALRNAAAQVQRHGPDRLEVAMVDGGETIDDFPFEWHITPWHRRSRTLVNDTAPSLDVALDPGSYRVEVDAGGVKRHARIEVSARDVKHHRIILNAGEMIATAVTEQPEQANEVMWTALPRNGKGQPIPLGRGASKRAYLAGSDYELVADLQEQRIPAPLTMKNGQTARPQINLKSSKLSLQARQTAGGKPVDAEWTLYRANPGSLAELGPVPYRTGTGSDLSMQVPQGNYLIYADGAQASAQHSLDVPADGVATAEVVLNIGGIELLAVHPQQELASQTAWQASNADGSIKVSGTGAIFTQSLPAGDYEVLAQLGRFERSRSLVVRAGQVTREEIALTASIQLKAVETKGGNPVSVRWNLRHDGPAGVAAPVAHSASGSQADFLLPAGQYQVMASHPEATISRMVEVGYDEANAVIFEMGLGELSVALTGHQAGGSLQDGRWSIIDINSDLKILEGQGPLRNRQFAAGTYRVDGHWQGMTASRTIELTAGERETVTLNLDAGELTVAASYLDPRTSDPVRWQITPANGQLAVADNADLAREIIGLNQQLRLPAGDYKVTASQGAHRASQQVTVPSGGTANLLLPLSGELKLQAWSSDPNGEAPAASLYVDWEVIALEGPQAGASLRQGSGNSANFRLSPGSYKVRASNRDATLEETVTVIAGESVSKSLIAGLGQLRLTAQRDASAEPVEVQWRLSKLQDGSPSLIDQATGISFNRNLASGEYLVEVLHPIAQQQHEFSVRAGKTNQMTIDLALGELLLTASSLIPSIEAAVNWQIHSSDNEFKHSLDGGRQALTLPAGSYRVKGAYSGISLEREISVASGERAEVDFAFTGSLHVKAFESGEDTPLPALWSVYREGDEENGAPIVRQAEQVEALFRLPAGKYRVVAEHGHGKSESVIDVVAGELREGKLIAGLGQLQARAVDPFDGSPQFVDWVLLDSSGEAIRRIDGSEITGTFPAGNYSLRMTHADGHRQTENVSITAGKPSDYAFKLQRGRLQAQASAGDSGSALLATWRLSTLESGSSGGAAPIYQFQSLKTDITLGAGQYLLEYGDLSHMRSTTITINAGETTQFRGDLSGKLDLNAVLADSKAPVAVEWRIRPDQLMASTDGNALALPDLWRFGEDVSLTLPQGRYLVFASHPENEQQLDVRVKAGTTVTEAVNMQLAKVDFKLALESGTESARWRIYTADRGRLAVDEIGPSLNQLIRPGQYLLQVIGDRATHEQVLYLIGGETTTEVISLQQRHAGGLPVAVQ